MLLAFLEILKYILPSVVVLLASYFAMKAFFNNEQNKRKMDIRSSNQKLITPIRLGAYERLVMFLERIQPESMLMRLQQKDATCKELHADMLSLIRAEFEHNLSQQVYVSTQAWEVIKSAKENTVKMLNMVAAKTKPDAPSFELSKAILEFIMQTNKTPSAVAIDYLKNEVRQFF
ncbi:MAG: hypothetical protein HY958_05605 [Bacteroidia bacterium]|nr:hypothetical protein [Bacteroidia bacterium]